MLLQAEGAQGNVEGKVALRKKETYRWTDGSERRVVLVCLTANRRFVKEVGFIC